MNLSDIKTESTLGPSGHAFRNVRQEQAARKLAEVTPLLTETLTHHWSTGQGTRVRHILWSLYSCSHLVNLGDACSGLDANLAEAVGTAIHARLSYGPEVEPLLGEILRVSGEFARFDREEAGYELTNSCAKAGHNVHWKVRTAKACGRCVPCIFRRASLHVADLDDEVYGNDVLAGKEDEFEDFYALLGLIRRNPDDAEIARALLSNGRLPIAKLDEFVEVERRMIEEVRSWLSAKASKAIKKYARIK